MHNVGTKHGAKQSFRPSAVPVYPAEDLRQDWHTHTHTNRSHLQIISSPLNLHVFGLWQEIKGQGDRGGLHVRGNGCSTVCSEQKQQGARRSSLNSQLDAMGEDKVTVDSRLSLCPCVCLSNCWLWNMETSACFHFWFSPSVRVRLARHHGIWTYICKSAKAAFY